MNTAETSTVEVPTTPKATENQENIAPTPDLPTEKDADALTPTAPMVAAELECDFDTNPTNLYLCIQEKKWQAAIDRASSDPKEASTWVSRKERNGKLRWRLLPLHAAIIFKAPVMTIQALIKANVKAAQCKDDQGMLPIHLAYRNGSEVHVANMLLVAYPNGVNEQDRKGRVPLAIAQASNSPLRDEYVAAIQRALVLHEIATATIGVQPAAKATILPSAGTTTMAMDDSEFKRMKEHFEKEKEELMKLHEQEKIEWDEKNTALEEELSKNQETSQVLVDHVNSLEAQLSSRSDTERFLATKIANLDSSLKDTSRNKELVEAQMQAEKVVLEEENSSLKIKANDLSSELESLKSKYKEMEDSTKKLTSIRENRKTRNDAQLKKLEADRAAAVANAAILEAQLKKKVEQEHSLASQVSDLAAQLALSAAANSKANNTYATRAETLEMEKLALEGQVQQLTKKLQQVVKALNCMSQEQERIVAQAADFEETMHNVSSEQSQLMADAARQEQILIDSAREREQIVSILTRQAIEIEKTTAERKRIMDVVSQQSSNMETAENERNALVKNVNKQKTEMADLVEDIKNMGILETTTFDDYEDDEDDDNMSDDEEEEAELEAIAALEKSKSEPEAVKSEEIATKDDVKTAESNAVEVSEEIKDEEVECRLGDGRTPDEILDSAMKLAE